MTPEQQEALEAAKETIEAQFGSVEVESVVVSGDGDNFTLVIDHEHGQTIVAPEREDVPPSEGHI